MRDTGAANNKQSKKPPTFVPPTSKLEAVVTEQHALTVPTLDELSTGSVAYEDLRAAVQRAMGS